MFAFQPRYPNVPHLSLSLLGVTLAILAGCGAKPSRNPGIEVFTTTVKVTLEGAPVEGARVSFNSTESQRSASGVSDAAGIAILTTFDYGDGAIAGNHEVKISKDVMETIKAADPNDPASGEITREKHLLPTRYGSFKTSALTAEVASGENQFTFDLKK